ncbi:epididymal-specific lipocalin-5-like [Suncus etruscus]|uniref:epididymal-specific lipocalin-5-like n=1 Tax=Suncus etruscus TaxID=109475 RepID=UPI002110CE70|nr:epididymal-specific lipocalin-5-like [Suncus etruscus]
MRDLVLAMLLSLIVTLAVQARKEQSKEFNLIQFLGIWYEVAIAAKPEDHTRPPRLQRMGAVKVDLAGSGLTLTATHDDMKHCVKEVAHIQRPESMKFRLQRKTGNKDVQLLNTDYLNYIILEMSEQSRTLETTQEALKKFHMEAEKRGMAQSDVHQLARDTSPEKPSHSS